MTRSLQSLPHAPSLASRQVRRPVPHRDTRGHLEGPALRALEAHRWAQVDFSDISPTWRHLGVVGPGEAEWRKSLAHFEIRELRALTRLLGICPETLGLTQPPEPELSLLEKRQAAMAHARAARGVGVTF
jgi:hypothetical protein